MNKKTKINKMNKKKWTKTELTTNKQKLSRSKFTVQAIYAV